MKDSYADLKTKLDNLLSELQNPDTDLDKALKLHDEAKDVLANLDAYLAVVKQKVDKAKS